MSTYQRQKEEILKFYNTTSDLVLQHQNTYGSLLKKLKKKKTIPKTMNTTYDFMTHFQNLKISKLKSIHRI